MKAAMIIGLGGLGVAVAHRIRTLFVNGPGGKVPDHVRLLSFDLLRTDIATGRLGPPYYFLVRLPVPEGSPLPTQRGDARKVLLADVGRGSSSLVLRGLGLNMEALRRAGYAQIDVFLVGSSFGVTGSSWLIDMAYLCRHLGQGRITINVHAVLLTPETCQRVVSLQRAHRLTNFTVLKELESFQRTRDWSTPYPIYGDKHIAGLPGLLSGAPFASVQLVDGQALGGRPDQSAIPAAAAAILCQLDEKIDQITRKALQPRGADPAGRACFSSLGVQTLVHPTRALADSGVQRLVLGLIESLLPLHKDPVTGRPLALESAPPLLPSAPYNDVENWLGKVGVSGVLSDVFSQINLGAAESANQRQAWVEQLAERETAQWQATLFQLENPAGLPPLVCGEPESSVPYIQQHFLTYLRALAEKTLSLAADPSGPQEYLTRLDSAFTDYIADLGRAEELLKRRGRHSEAPAVRQAVEESFHDWDSKKNSSWSRLFPQRIEEAQERYQAARQLQQSYQQHEALIKGVRKSASLMLNLTRKLLGYYQYYVRALALGNDSLYNQSLDLFQRIKRELDDESAVRSQRLVVDEAFEERQIRLIFERYNQTIFAGIKSFLLQIAGQVDWLGDSLQIRAEIEDPDALDGRLDLADTGREAEETAGLLLRWFNRALSQEISAALNENSILKFLNYLDPRAEQLGKHMVQRSEPLAKTIVPPVHQAAFLFTPDPDAAERLPYVRDLLYEFYHQFSEFYQIPNADPQQVVLFRRFDALSLDNLDTFLASDPEKIKPAELQPYLLWVL